jgi:hypothetical protein
MPRKAGNQDGNAYRTKQHADQCDGPFFPHIALVLHPNSHHCKYLTPPTNHSARSISRTADCRKCLAIYLSQNPGELKTRELKSCSSRVCGCGTWLSGFEHQHPEHRASACVYLSGIQWLGQFLRFGHRIATLHPFRQQFSPGAGGISWERFFRTSAMEYAC